MKNMKECKFNLGSEKFKELLKELECMWKQDIEDAYTTGYKKGKEE